MSPKYLFPCSQCDHHFELVLKQAGQDLQCPKCQHHCEAPILGKMKQLEMIGESEPEKHVVSSGGSLRNLLFVAGVALAIMSGASSYMLYQYANSMIYEIDYELESKNFNEDVDAMSPGQVVALYDLMDIEKGLGDWYEPNFVRYNTQGDILKKISYGLVGIAGLGVLLFLGSFFVRR